MVVLAVLVAACGDDASGPEVRFALPGSGLPAPLAVPWPSDVYRDADGTVADGLVDWTLAKIDNPEPSAMIGQIGALDGFGQLSGVVFSISGLAEDEGVDVATLEADPPPFALIDLETGMRVPSSVGWDAYAQAITIVPSVALAPGHRYAGVLLAGIATTTGRPIAATSQLAKLRKGSGGSAAEMLYRQGFADVGAAGIASESIIGLSVYTTQTSYRVLKRIRDRLASGALGAAPAFNTGTVTAPFSVKRFGASAHAGWTATLDEWLGTARKDTSGNDLPGAPGDPEPASTGLAHDSIAAVVTGTFVSPQFPRTFTKTAGYDDGTIAFDGAGNAIPADATAQIPVAIVVPKGPVPAGGFPVVIFQHGLGGDRFVMFTIANELARAGIATASIDAPVHGLRQPTPTDTLSNGKGTFTGPDGFADSSNALALLDFNGNMRSLLRGRDVNWQAVLDLVQLRRMLGSCDLTAIADEFGGTPPRLDSSHVGYIGMSLGGGLGTLFAGVEPRSSVDPFVLDVPPAVAAHLFSESPVYSAQLALIAAAANLKVESIDAGIHSALAQLVQAVADPIESTMFAPDAAAEHNLWMIIGGNDETVPYHSSLYLARAFGATQLTPTLRPIAGLATAASTLTPGASGRVVGFYEVAPANHGHLLERYSTMNYEPPFPRDAEPRFPKLPNKIRIREPVLGAQRAVIAFLASVWAGAPVISVADPRFMGLLPVSDLDDDGYCDATERTAGTDPYAKASAPTGAADCQRDLGF